MEQKNRTNFEISENKNNCNQSVKFTTETETLVHVTSNNNEPEVKEDIDYILDNIVGGGDGGDIGQWIILSSLIPVVLCAGFPLFMHLFACFEPRHRCFIPNCDTLSTPNIDSNWTTFGIPTNDANNEIKKSTGITVAFRLQEIETKKKEQPERIKREREIQEHSHEGKTSR